MSPRGIHTVDAMINLGGLVGEVMALSGCADLAATLTAGHVKTLFAADRTLGGLCDWVEAEAPRPVDLPVEGAASLKAAVIPVILH